MQRLFSMFPTAGPGAALVILRLSVALALLIDVPSRMEGFLPAWVVPLLALLLSLGLLTPILGHAEWTSEIAAMILEHHKISPYRRDSRWLVEPFRRADWVDVSRGLITFGLSRRLVREIFAAWPSAGFHKRLVQLELTRLRTHPWNPLPMMRL